MSLTRVHGLGYVGLATAALFPNASYDIVGYDPSERARTSPETLTVQGTPAPSGVRAFAGTPPSDRASGSARTYRRFNPKTPRFSAGRSSRGSTTENSP